VLPDWVSDLDLFQAETRCNKRLFYLLRRGSSIVFYLFMHF
jgi:hypothetical protein